MVAAHPLIRPHAAGGFTLIELLVVVTIISVLSSLLLVTVNLVRASAHRSVCSGNLRQLTMATITYATDNDGLLPEAGGNSNHGFYGQPFCPSQLSVLDYFGGNPTHVMRCPANPRSPIFYSFHGGQARDFPHSLQWLIDFARRHGVPDNQPSLWADQLVTDVAIGDYRTSCNHKSRQTGVHTGVPAGGNAAFADGSVRWLPFKPNAPSSEAGWVFNGGSIGGSWPISTTCVMIFTDGAFNLDTSRTFPVVIGAQNLTGF